MIVQFDYTAPLERQVVNVVLTPSISINTENMTLQGQYQETVRDMATGQESLDPYTKPFTIQLDAAFITDLLGRLVPLALAQGVLRPSTTPVVTP